jgi:hypothetical protein
VKAPHPTNAGLTSDYTFTDYNAGSPTIIPGAPPVDVPLAHCVVPVQAEVEINGATTVGSTFSGITVTYNGSNTEKLQNYRASGTAYGQADLSGVKGTVPICMPAADYVFDTSVTALSESGAESTTSLLKQSASFRCDAVVIPFSFEIELEEVACAGGDLDKLTFNTTATSIGDGGRPEYAYAWVNGGPDAGGQLIDLCGGSAPVCDDLSSVSFSFDVDTSELAQCGNNVEVYVLSTSGKLSKSGLEEFDFERTGPSGRGCEDVALKLDPVTGTASLDLFEVSSGLNECGLGLTEETLCVVYDTVSFMTVVAPVEEGSSIDLTAGVYEGQCFVSTGCGERSCTFGATVAN